LSESPERSSESPAMPAFNLSCAGRNFREVEDDAEPVADVAHHLEIGVIRHRINSLAGSFDRCDCLAQPQYLCISLVKFAADLSKALRDLFFREFFFGLGELALFHSQLIGHKNAVATKLAA
jgi:hypothetical protein